MENNELLLNATAGYVICCLELGQYEDAEKKIMDIEYPALTAAFYCYLSEFLLKKSDFEKAKFYFKKAIELNKTVGENINFEKFLELGKKPILMAPKYITDNSYEVI